MCERETDSTARASISISPTPLDLNSMNTPTKRKFRHAVGSVDTNSEEDTEIDIIATSTSAGVLITHQAFSTSKRLKTNHPDGQAESAPHNIAVESATVEHPHSQENLEEEKGRKNQVCLS